jgi:Replication-relaxation
MMALLSQPTRSSPNRGPRHTPGRLTAPEDDLRRKSRSRFQPEPSGGLLLGPRDYELLADLFRHGAMARSHLQALYFTSLPRCNYRLRQLYDHGYLSRHYAPADPCALPYGVQAVYTLGQAAVRPVAAHLEVDVRQVSEAYRRHKTPRFLEHTLAIVDLRVALHEAAIAPKEAMGEAAAASGEAVAIERWLPETLCRHEYELRPASGGAWRREVFKPDAFVRLQRPGARLYRNYFFEVDLGHTNATQFSGKLASHQRYLESGLFRETYGGDEFRTLVVTTTASRLRNLRALVEAQHSDLFWFATFATIREHGILGPIWQAPFATGGPTLP